MADDNPREPTRKELAEELAKSREANERLLARLEAIEAKVAAPPVRIPATAPLYAGPDPVKVPYQGLVRATARCCYGHLREEGAVFEVAVDALWTDDPYEAVILIGEHEDGSPKTERNPKAPTPIEFRFRKAVSAAEDPTPRKASSY